MDGAASAQASVEASGAADLDPRRPTAAAVVEGQGYVESLLGASLQLLRKGLPHEIRRQGLKLMLMKDELGNLMKMLREAGFFNVDDDREDWDNKFFSESIDQFNKMVFPGQCVHKCLVVRGIMDYEEMSHMKDVDWQYAFKMVVSNTNKLWKENLRQFWVTTRHYEHDYYNILAQPLQQVFLKGGAPKPRYGRETLARGVLLPN